MPQHKTRQWTSTDTRGVILDACYEMLQEHAVQESAPFADLSIPQVARRANELWSIRYPIYKRTLGPGAVRGNFPGGQPGLILETIRARVVPDLIGAALADFDDALEEAEHLPQPQCDEYLTAKRVALAVTRFHYMRTSNETPAYLHLLAHHRLPTVQNMLAEMYESFDAALIPRYQRMLDLMDRSLVPPLTLNDFAASFTAITEGFAIRAVVHQDFDDRHASELVRRAAQGILTTMTIKNSPAVARAEGLDDAEAKRRT